MLAFSDIVPCPTKLIPGIASNPISYYKKTLPALKQLNKELNELKPDTLLILSAHGKVRYDKFTINLESKLFGSFDEFGSENFKESFISNKILIKKILGSAKKIHIPVDLIRESKLDYGTYLAIYYLLLGGNNKPKIVPLTHTNLNYEINYKFGQIIGKEIKNSNEKVAVIISGDLSHRLSKESPIDFSPYGEKFDKTLIELLEKNDLEKLLGLNPDFADEAHETSLKNILINLGILSQFKNSNFKKMAYESPFGVGHLVGKWEILN